MNQRKKLSLAIPLPVLEVSALLSGETIAALTKRSLNKGQSFALYPLSNETAEFQYHPEVLTQHPPQPHTTTETVELFAWAECEMCEAIADPQEMERLANCTIWTPMGLMAQKGDRPFLFIAYLRVYRWVQPQTIPSLSTRALRKQGLLVAMDAKPALESLGSAAIFTDAEFKERCEKLQNRQGREPEPPSKPGLVNPPPPEPDFSWIERIAEVGNSSEGHEFERLVRRSFQFLGFSNSQPSPKANLDPDATGGAGGLDFYADQPYAIVGECKATKTEKVPDGTAAALLKLGQNHLSDQQYNDAIKIIVAAGKLTSYAQRTAANQSMNVLRPETIERLVKLKFTYPGAIDLWKFKDLLEQEPFSEESDQKINSFIDSIQAKIAIRKQLIGIVKNSRSESRGISCAEIYGIFNHQSGQRSTEAKKRETYNVLIEIASPFLGYIGHQRTERWENDRFYFLRDLDVGCG